MYDPSLQAQIAEWRSREAAGQMDLDEYKKVLAALREGRLSAASAPRTSRAAKAPARSSVDLLSEFDNL